MKLIDVREKLAKINQPLITLQDVIGIFQIEKSHASHLMSRLAKAGSLIKIRRGLWAWPNIEPLSIPTYLTAPLPSYISLQSALFYHGMIDQVPGHYYGVTLGRKLKVNTPFGVFSLHHIDANFFFDYTTYTNPFFQIATPEKAILDYFYLSRTDPKLFGKLPEIDIRQLKVKKIREIVNKIADPKIKAFLKNKLSNFLNIS